MQEIDQITGRAMQSLADHLDDIDHYARSMIRRSVQMQLARKPGFVRDSRLSSEAQRLIRTVTDDAVEDYLLHRSTAA